MSESLHSKGDLSTCEGTTRGTTTTALTSAVRSAQIVPPQEVPVIRALVRVFGGNSGLILTIRSVVDASAFDYPAVDSEQSSADAEP